MIPKTPTLSLNLKKLEAKTDDGELVACWPEKRKNVAKWEVM